MNQNFQLFVGNCINLVRSLVIKSEESANGQNMYIEGTGKHVDYSDPSTWRYYKHLRGEYHEIDKPIKIISSDTQQETVFDRPTLIGHPITLLSSGIGGRFYKELRDANPRYNILIEGVSRPVDTDTAYNARNFEILAWDKRFLSEGEEGLIGQLQGWIDLFVERWYNPDFALTDNLYTAAFIGTMVPHLVSMVVTYRLENARTPRVGNFFLWNDLAGHYQLNNHRPYLSRKQALYLYRNIRYIRTNAGRDDVLHDLLSNLVVPKGLTVDKFSFVHDDTGKLLTGKHRPRFVKGDYFSNELKTEASNLVDPASVLELTRSRRPDNDYEFDDDLRKLKKAGELALESNLPTPLLRVNENATVGLIAESSNQLKMDYWVYLSTLGLYNPDISFRIPGQTYDSYMKASDALILLVYALNMSMGIETEFIPDLNVKNVLPVVYPTTTDLMKFIDRKKVTVEDLDVASEHLLSLRPLANTNELAAFIEEVKNQRTRHSLLWSTKPCSVGRSIYRSAIGGFYTWHECKLKPVQTRYNDWLSEMQISKYDMSEYAWADLARIIMVVAADIVVDNSNLPANKSAMVEIVDDLTSYNLKIIRGEGTSDYRTMDWHDSLIQEVEGSSADHAILDYGIDVRQDSTSDVSLVLENEIPAGLDAIEKDGPYVYKADINVGLEFELNNKFAVDEIIDVGFNAMSPVTITVLED